MRRRSWPPGALLSGLDEQKLHLLLSRGRVERFERGAVLPFSEVAEDELYCLLSSSVSGRGTKAVHVPWVRVGGDVIARTASRKLEGPCFDFRACGVEPVLAVRLRAADLEGAAYPSLIAAVEQEKSVPHSAFGKTGTVTMRLAALLVELALEYGVRISATKLLITARLQVSELAEILGLPLLPVRRAWRALVGRDVVGWAARYPVVNDFELLSEAVHDPQLPAELVDTAAY